MDSKQVALRQRQEILDQIAALGPLRPGSVTEQFVPTRRKDGTRGRRGPYVHYTFKRNQKTFGKQLRGPGQAQLYREQIERFRRFQALSAEFVSVSQRLADLEVEESDSKKNSGWTSKPNSNSRRRSSSRP